MVTKLGTPRGHILGVELLISITQLDVNDMFPYPSVSLSKMTDT